MPKRKKLKWKDHKEKWINCYGCDLCEQRDKVVLLRGKIPCDVLFIGEAPGVSEDTLGKPFVGPAGTLLDNIIEESDPGELKLAWTNVIACIPKDDDGHKVKEPPRYSIEACSDRLLEVVKLCNPSTIVTVGKLSEVVCKKLIPKKIKGLMFENIIHPAAILRMGINKGLAVQRTRDLLTDLFSEVKNPVPF